MIEMLGVLAIIGVLSVGGIAGYSKAMLKFKTNKTIDQIAMTVTNIRTLYAQQNTYAGLSTSNAYKMGVIDDAMATTGKDAEQNDVDTITNAFGGEVYIGTDEAGAVGESATLATGAAEGATATKQGAFIVSFAGLPREACVNIATNDWGSNYSSGLLGIQASTGNPVTSMNCFIAGGPKDAQNVAANTLDDGISCAKHNQPLSVKDAAKGCACTGNGCVVTLKYF